MALAVAGGSGRSPAVLPSSLPCSMMRWRWRRQSSTMVLSLDPSVLSATQQALDERQEWEAQSRGVDGKQRGRRSVSDGRLLAVCRVSFGQRQSDSGVRSTLDRNRLKQLGRRDALVIASGRVESVSGEFGVAGERLRRRGPVPSSFPPFEEAKGAERLWRELLAVLLVAHPHGEEEAFTPTADQNGTRHTAKALRRSLSTLRYRASAFFRKCEGGKDGCVRHEGSWSKAWRPEGTGVPTVLSEAERYGRESQTPSRRARLRS
nr:hypothetical protein Iba_chr09aCG12300 [Ipomoea batatas]